LFFGIKTIVQLKDTVNQVELNTIINDIKDKTEEYYYLDEGSLETIKLRLPEKIEYICFKNETYSNNNNKVFQKYPELRDIFKVSQDNIFFVPIIPNKKTSFKINNIILKEGNLVLCKNKELKITSKGFYVEFS